MSINRQVRDFYIPLHASTRVIIVALLANGVSSYRDAAALSRLCTIKYQSQVSILTDNVQQVDNQGPMCQHMVQIKTKKQLLNSLSDLVAQVPAGADLIFLLSAHGYSQRLASRCKLEFNGRTEYIKVGKKQTVLDYELMEALYRCMHQTVKSVCFIDTCHSGTMLDLEYICTDAKTFRRSRTPFLNRPASMCLSVGNDEEMTGEDISEYGGWGGKLTGQLLDWLNNNCSAKMYPWQIYEHIYSLFNKQLLQRTHPTVGFNTGNKPPGIVCPV